MPFPSFILANSSSTQHFCVSRWYCYIQILPAFPSGNSNDYSWRSISVLLYHLSINLGIITLNSLEHCFLLIWACPSQSVASALQVWENDKLGSFQLFCTFFFLWIVYYPMMHSDSHVSFQNLSHILQYCKSLEHLTLWVDVEREETNTATTQNYKMKHLEYHSSTQKSTNDTLWCFRRKSQRNMVK